MGGTNAVGKVQRDKNIEESIKLLTIIAEKSIGLEYATHLINNFHEDVQKQMELLKNENNKILKLKQVCLNKWEKLEMHVNQM